MFSVMTKTKCHCCPTIIDCKNDTLHHFITKQGGIRYLCDECSLIDVMMEKEDYLFWGFSTAEDYIRYTRKEQMRLEKSRKEEENEKENG